MQFISKIGKRLRAFYFWLKRKIMGEPKLNFQKLNEHLNTITTESFKSIRDAFKSGREDKFDSLFNESKHKYLDDFIVESRTLQFKFLGNDYYIHSMPNLTLRTIHFETWHIDTHPSYTERRQEKIKELSFDVLISGYLANDAPEFTIKFMGMDTINRLDRVGTDYLNKFYAHIQAKESNS